MFLDSIDIDTTWKHSPIITFTCPALPKQLTFYPRGSFIHPNVPIYLLIDNVKIRPKMYFNIPNPTVICPGNHLTITASMPGDSILFWDWSSTPSGFNATTQSINISPYISTIYKVVATDTMGCYNTAYDTVNVYPLTTPIINGRDTVCQGETITYYTQGEKTNYNWSVSSGGNIIAGGNANSDSITIKWNNAGLQFIKVNYMDSICLSDTTTKYILVLPIPIVNAGNDTTICLGSSVILGSNPTATGAPDLSYSWNPLFSSNNTSANPTVIPNSTTTYIVTVTSSNGCGASDEIIVTVKTALTPPIISGHNNNCDSICIYTITNYSDTSFIWSINNTIYTTNVNNININWNNFPEISIGNPTTIRVVYIANGCSSTDSIMVFACCQKTEFESFHDTAIYTSDIVPNTKYFFNGVVTLDSNITLNHNTFYMGQEAKIYVSPSIQFNIDSNSILMAGCEYMWDGVYVDTTSSMIAVTNGSTIKWAINGLVSTNGGVIKLDDANMIDNYYNVKISNATITPYPGYIRNTRFTGTASLPYPPYQGKKTLVGVYCDTVHNITIGDYNSEDYLNTFDSLQYGIYAFKSNISIYNNQFTNIAKETAMPPFHILPSYPEGAVYTMYEYHNPPISGSSIFSRPSILKVGGMKEYPMRNIFDKCITGIQAYGYLDSLYSNLMTNNDVGISLVDVKNNSAISNNIIGQPNFFNTAIRIKNDYAPITINLSVYDNVIQHYRTGISLTNIWSDTYAKAIVHNNYIQDYISDPTTQNIGININNCNHLQVNNNNISRYPLPALTSNNNVHGIKIANSIGATVFRNGITQMGSGIYTSGDLTNTQFECNILHENYYGIQFESGSAISNQGHDSIFNPANAWYDFYNTDRAYKTGPIANPFNYYYGIADFLPIPNTLGNQINIIQNSTNSNYCSNDTLLPYPNNITTAEAREAAIGKTVRNQLVFDTLQTEYIARAREYAYLLLDEDDNDLIYMYDTSDYVYEAFYNTMLSSDAAHALNFVNATTTHKINLNFAYQEINLIADTNAINHNRIVVDNIYLNTWAHDNYQLTEEQIRILEGIAYLNPLTNGDAVYTARVMLNINPDEDSYENKSLQQYPKKDIKPNEVHVFPNPAKESITVTFDYPIANDGVIELWSIMGCKLISRMIPKDYREQKININGLTSGIYFYIIKINGNKFASGKLIILNK